MTKEDESGERVMHVGVERLCWKCLICYKDRRVIGRTFLNSYRSVSLLYCHSFLRFLGRAKGSVGCQYSTNPPSSADITVSYLSLYWGKEVDDALRSRKVKDITYCHDVNRESMY